jgi:hypothetical protein
MKKSILLLLITLSTLSINAQKDKLVFPTAENPSLSGQFIVIDSKGTIQENYKKVKDYINKNYKVPTEVIKSDIKDEYIRIEGYASQLYKVGFSFTDGTYVLDFKFKQDRIKFTYISSNNGVMDLNFSYPDLFKKNGKPKKLLINYNKNLVDGLNSLMSDIASELKKEKATEEDW